MLDGTAPDPPPSLDVAGPPPWSGAGPLFAGTRCRGQVGDDRGLGLTRPHAPIFAETVTSGAGDYARSRQPIGPGRVPLRAYLPARLPLFTERQSDWGYDFANAAPTAGFSLPIVGCDRPAEADPLAIRIRFEAGQEVAWGEPSVTDEERAAAGRETLAKRRMLLLPANRRRALENRSSGLPEGQQMLRVWSPRHEASLRERLGDESLAVWAEGDILHVLWQGQADSAHVGGGVHFWLWPVEGSDDLWEGSLRVRRLDEAVISVFVAPGDDFRSSVVDSFVWRGDRAPAPEPARPLEGTLEESVFDSSALQEPRGLTIYCPPGRAPVFACVLADGASVRNFAQGVEASIVRRTLAPVLLVGATTATTPTMPGPTGALESTCPTLTLPASTPTSGSWPTKSSPGPPPSGPYLLGPGCRRVTRTVASGPCPPPSDGRMCSAPWFPSAPVLAHLAR